jgi:hypothetical protein
MVFAVIVLFLLALVGCAWGFWLSVKLMIRSFHRLTAPTFGPPAGPPQDGPTMPLEAGEPVTRLPVPGWTDKLISDHIATCTTCREEYVSGTLPLLETETVTRLVALVEAHEPVAP